MLTAARRALARADLDAALVALDAALATATPRTEPELALLVEHAGHLGRWAHSPELVREFLDRAIAAIAAPGGRARVLHAAARLDAYLGRDEDRLRELRAAVSAYRTAGDPAGVAIAQSDLAFPVGPVESLVDRLVLAAEALDLARSSGAPLAVVACAGTHARVLLELGDRAAYDVWREGHAALPQLGPLPPWAADVAPRFFYNWARALAVYGDYPGAARTADEGKRHSDQPYWRRSFAVVDAVCHWRLGDWTAAAQAVRVALDGDWQPGIDLAEIVDGHLRHEREGRPDAAALETLTGHLVDDENVGAPIALALLVRIRHVRREPNPERGLHAVVDTVLRNGRRMGWEDVLPAAAAASPATARRELDRVADRMPTGPRADAALLHTRGLLELHDRPAGAGDTLADAATAYLDLGEPYLAGHAFAAAGLARHRAGRPLVALRQQAADLFRSLGADRSLAALLRGSAGPRAVSGVRVPASQRNAPSLGLTRREADVALLASRGYTAEEIGAQLHIGARTVYTHLQSAKAKLGVRRKSELVRLFGDDRR